MHCRRSLRYIHDLEPVCMAIVQFLAAASLASCGSISDQTAEAAFTSPGKYTLYTCQDIEAAIAAQRVRQVELEQLMARASNAAGGEFVNAIAYRSEYAQVRGHLIALAQAKSDKQCTADNKFSSGRAVY
jgi:hypothetical protein